MPTNHVTPANGDIFTDLNVPDAENEKKRLILLGAIREWFEDAGMTQEEAAKAIGIKQPVFNDVLQGRYRKFTIDRLVKLLAVVEGVDNTGCID
ncbi:MAG: XRE family transcriptional regulator [Sedimenticola sp.]